MDRLALAVVVALAALVLGGQLTAPPAAGELPAATRPAGAPLATPPPGRRGIRVLGLVVALEALRAAPDLLTPNTSERRRTFSL